MLASRLNGRTGQNSAETKTVEERHKRTVAAILDVEDEEGLPIDAPARINRSRGSLEALGLRVGEPADSLVKFSCRLGQSKGPPPKRDLHGVV